MPQVISVGNEELEFPDDISDDEIQAILSREYPKFPAGTTLTSTEPVDFQFEPADILGEQSRQLPNLQATTRGGPRLQLPDANVAAQSALGELGGVAGDVLTHPSPIPTPFPEIGKDENPFVAAGKEVVNLAVGVPQFFTTTPGIVAAGGATVAPGLVSGLFTADLLKTLGKQIKDTYSNWSSMTGAQKAIAVTDLIGTGAFAALTAKHAGKSALDFAEQNVPRGIGEPTTEKGLDYAGQIVQPTEVPELEVRPRLGEEAPLRPERPAPEPRPPADVGGDVVPIEKAPPPAPVKLGKPSSSALRDVDTGEVWYGEPTHGLLHEKIPNIESRNLEAGFADKDGKFLTTKQVENQTGLSSGEELFVMTPKERQEWFEAQKEQVEFDDSLTSGQKKSRIEELNKEKEKAEKWAPPPAPEVAPATETPEAAFVRWAEGKDLNAEQDKLARTASLDSLEADYRMAETEAARAKKEADDKLDEKSLVQYQNATAALQFLSETIQKKKARPPVADYTGEPGEVAVSAEELKPALGVGSDFADWVNKLDELTPLERERAIKNLADATPKELEQWKAKLLQIQLQRKIGDTTKEVAVTGEELQQPKAVALKPEPPAQPPPATPAQAAGKVQEQVKAVAKAEGVRSAKEIKADLVAQLEAAHAKASVELEGPATVKFEIPGDGDFTVVNTKANLAAVLAAAKKISTTKGNPPNTPKVRQTGDVDEQAKAAAKAYGSSEKAYQSTQRQIEQLKNQEPPRTAEERQAISNQILGAEHLLQEIYGNTSPAKLEAQAEAARDRVATYKEGAKGFEDAIAKLEKVKRPNQASKDRLADLKERYQQNQDFIRTNEANAEKWEQQAAKEKAALEPTPAAAPSPAVKPVEGEGPIGMGGAVPSEFEQQPGRPLR